MIGPSELRIVCDADTTTVRKLRHALGSFLAVFAFGRDVLDDVLLASGEVLSNAVEHGAGERGRSTVELTARSEKPGTLAVAVSDRGEFIERERLPNRGFGLSIAQAIAQSVTIERGAGQGTRVELIFDVASPPNGRAS